MATKTNGYTKGRATQNMSPSTQREDSSLRAVKTYDNAESRAGRKEDSWEVTNSDANGCNQEATLAYSRQTSV